MSLSDGSRSRGLALAACTSLVVAISGVAGAHGGLDLRLERATGEIASAADTPDPLLRRAQLYASRGRFGEAHGDLDRAARLAPGLAEVDYHRGLVLLQQGEPARALLALDRLLASVPGHLGGHVARGRTLRSLQRPLEAAMAYSQAIERAAVAAPEPYLERARALADAGSEHRAAALAGLDEGIEALGPLPALTRAAVELEVSAGRIGAALRRIEREIARSRLPVWWLARKGELLDAQGRRAEAREAYGEALRQLRVRPALRRRGQAWRDLEEQLNGALVETKREPDGESDVETMDRRTS